MRMYRVELSGERGERSHHSSCGSVTANGEPPWRAAQTDRNHASFLSGQSFRCMVASTISVKHLCEGPMHPKERWCVL